MKFKKLLSTLLSCMLLIAVSSCFDKSDVYDSTSKGKYFDFDYNLNQKIALDIDYGFEGLNYIVLFDLYDQNPLVEDEDGISSKDETIQPIYRAATDGNGRFTGSIELQSALTEVWLHADYPGTISPVKVEIVGNTLSFHQNDYINGLRSGKNTRAITPSNKIYPDGWLTLGDWNERGTPNYLLSERILPPARTLNNINQVYLKYYSNLASRHPELIDHKSSEIKIVKSTKINLVFINSSASWNNAVGYFTYPTGEAPTDVSQIKRIIAFPNTSPLNKQISGKDAGGGLASGDQVQLKYWDGNRFHDEFPEGVSIAFWLRGNTFKEGNISTNSFYDRFSLPHLNGATGSVPQNMQRTVALRDSQTDQIVALGFEDNQDLRYNDAIFYLSISEKGAISSDLPALPDVGAPPVSEDNSVSYFGTLTFEDLWPHDGDYDMNDVIIDYKSTVYKQIIGNSVYKIVDEFTPRHKGGSIMNGFGYQLSNLLPRDIHSVAIQGPTQSRYMEGETLEPGQTHPTLLLFDNMGEVINSKFTVTIQLNDVNESNARPPYNPFIFVQSNTSRGHEVHLVKQLPTDKADMSLFGTGSDKSSPGQGVYYVSQLKLPFALNLPSIKNFPIPEEGVRIDESYPDFSKWVESNGTKYKDWYLK